MRGAYIYRLQKSHYIFFFKFHWSWMDKPKRKLKSELFLENTFITCYKSDLAVVFPCHTTASILWCLKIFFSTTSVRPDNWRPTTNKTDIRQQLNPTTTDSWQQPKYRIWGSVTAANQQETHPYKGPGWSFIK